MGQHRYSIRFKELVVVCLKALGTHVKNPKDNGQSLTLEEMPFKESVSEPQGEQQSVRAICGRSPSWLR